MSPWRAIGRGLYRYGLYDGRASRAEFWWLALFALAVAGLGAALDGLLWQRWRGGPLGALASLGMIVPLVCVSIRRVQDTGQRVDWRVIVVPILGLILYAAALSLRGGSRPPDEEDEAATSPPNARTASPPAGTAG